MKKRTIATLFSTHALVLAIGFGAGIYALPILTAPEAPSSEQVLSISAQQRFTAQFTRELKDSDALHWGEGTVTIGDEFIALDGKLSPGPDFKVYLAKEFVETEADFNRLKSEMVQVADIKTFDNFLVPITANVNVAEYNTLIVWCESFGQFITAAQYQQITQS
ncbi:MULTISPECIES: DM13 domain-containing protein [Shewanella]|uniref:DM13 domain-containing protein n=1 Tax=Shewanella electrodiphila TaxID=934143 RepID=A0ABT0KLN9_9GAMM|nr:DM13 domain-containing protein [Shewanella electrodiphila]MCL1044762.1 DM13 domain-containing protein [Shewanella electrodiphila]